MAFTWSRGFVAAGPGIHLGVDLAAALGTPAYIIHGGRVAYAGDTRTDPSPPWWSYWQGQRGAGGIALAVDVGGGRLEHYAHNSALFVQPGQLVVAGQRYGSVGATGHAFGSHVHYGVSDGRTWRDPLAGTTKAALLAAIAGRSLGGAQLVSTGQATGQATAQVLAWLEAKVRPQIGRSTWRAVFQASGSLDFWNIGNPNNFAVQSIAVELRYLNPEIPDVATITQADYDRVVAGISEGSLKDVLGVDPLGIGSATNGLVTGIGDAIGGALGGFAWLVAILVLLILGLYVTVTGGSSSNA